MKRPHIIGRITSAESSHGRPWPQSPSRAEREMSDEDKAMCLPVNLIDFGSHGGTPPRPTAPKPALTRAINRLLGR